MDLLDRLTANKGVGTSSNLEKDSHQFNEEGVSILLLFEGRAINNTLKYEIAKLFRANRVSLKEIKQVAIPVALKPHDYFQPVYEKEIIDYSKGCDVCVAIGYSNYFPCKGDGNLNTYQFIDVFLNPSYYWSSLLGLVTFPCFSVGEQEGSSWKRNHFSEQIKRIVDRNYNIRWYNEPEPIVKVINANEFSIINSLTEASKGMLAIDIETTGFDFRKDDILNIAFSSDGITGYVIPWRLVNIEEFNSFVAKFPEVTLSNGKFDTKFLRHKGINYEMTFDTMLAGHFLNEERSNSLKTHAHIYTTMGGYEEELESYKRRYKVKNYGNIPEYILFKYAGLDPIATWRITKKQMRELEKFPEISSLFYDIGLPGINVFIDVEMKGMNINWDKMEEVREYYKGEVTKLDKEMVEGLIDSTNLELDDLVETRRKLRLSLDLSIEVEEEDYYLHDNRNELSRILSTIVDIDSLDPGFLNTKGEIRTNEDTLNFLIQLHPELKPYLMRASLLTSYRLFLDEREDKGLNRYRQIDDKVHPSYSVMMATTHRYKCREPNVQQIPSNSAAGREAILALRKIFTVPNEDEYYFAEIDFSSFQLRIGSIYSGDEILTNAWINGDDLHTTTLRHMKYPDLTLDELVQKMKEEPEVKMERNSVGKQSNFGFFFGMSAYTAYINNIKGKWTDKQINKYCADKNLQILDFEGKPNKGFTVATSLRDIFFETYWGLESWIATQKETAIRQGYVMSSFGSRKLLTQLKLSDPKERLKSRELKHLLNICVNAPVQAFEAAHITKAMIFIHNKIKEEKLKSSLVGMIHDSILMYVFKEEKDIIKEIILEATTKRFNEAKNIPIRIEGSLSDFTMNDGWKNGQDWIFDTDHFN